MHRIDRVEWTKQSWRIFVRRGTKSARSRLEFLHEGITDLRLRSDCCRRIRDPSPSLRPSIIVAPENRVAQRLPLLSSHRRQQNQRRLRKPRISTILARKEADRLSLRRVRNIV